jgi:hypothetical protein
MACRQRSRPAVEQKIINDRFDCHRSNEYSLRMSAVTPFTALPETRQRAVKIAKSFISAKHFCTYTTIILRHDEILRDHAEQTRARSTPSPSSASNLLSRTSRTNQSTKIFDGAVVRVG